jgi:hypothetical protein
MADRSEAEIRAEIAAERQRLVDDVSELRKEARSAIPIAIAALIALAVVSRGSGLPHAAKVLWKLRY